MREQDRCVRKRQQGRLLGRMDGCGGDRDRGLGRYRRRKTHHHCVVIDAEGRRLLSRRVANDETELLGLLGDAVALGDSVTWAVDLNAGGAALLITLLINHDQRVLYIPGRVVHRASAMYRGEGKTDARDAAVIADQARMRRDLRPLRDRDQIAVDLRTLTARRADIAADRTRARRTVDAVALPICACLPRSRASG